MNVEAVKRIALGVEWFESPLIGGQIKAVILGNNPRDWRKANPNYGISVNPLDFEQALTKSLNNVYAQDVFKTKRLNMWVSTEFAWMDTELWKACGRPGIKPEDYKHLPCYMGLDLAQKIDMSAKAQLFVDEIERKYYLIIKYYISETTAARSSSGA